MQDVIYQYRFVESEVVDDLDALVRRAHGFAMGGRLAEAAACWQAVVRLRPDLPAVHNNLGSTLRLLGRDEDAASCFRTALGLDPDYPEACNNLGALLCELGPLADGVALLRRAVDLRPDYARAHCNLGKALREQGHIEAARDCFRLALRHDVELAEAHWHLAQVLLLDGVMPEGWAEFEWRPRSRSSALAWRGERLGDRTLLLLAPQDISDTIQFCRYVPLLAGAGRVVLRVQPELVGLLDGVAVVSAADPMPACDLHCDLLSLPHIFGTTLDTIPVQMPYLRAEPEAVAAWRDRLSGLEGPRVGVVWGESPIAPVAGISFVSLNGPVAGVHDPMPALGDFADMAALIGALDLVISVDTTVVHLAGAMGKPVWLLNRFDTDWRWMRDRSDSPWYPSLRQFRQVCAGYWGPVSDAVRAALHDLPNRPGSAADAAFQEGLGHHAAERWPEAERCYRTVLAHWPEHFPSLHQLGLIALRYRKPEAAIDLFARAVRHCPDEPAMVNNLGSAFHDAGLPADAAACYREALRLRPSDAKTVCNLGISLADLGDMAAAEACYRQGLVLQPGLADLHLALGSLLLATGRLTEGWPEFLWRRRIGLYQARSYAGAEWQGEPPGDRTLLLYADEGIGDAIQCVRYLPLVDSGNIVVVVQPELVRLFRCLTGRVVAAGEVLPMIHLHRPLLDLPGLLGVIPSDVPYLRVDPALSLHWHRRLEHLSGFRVGIAWAGNPGHTADMARSIPLARLAPLFAAFPEVRFISLQKGDVRREIADLGAERLHDFMDEVEDFADTAALMETLDLVIAVDTAVVHLAGALALPVWLLNRFNADWRWQRGVDDSLWYPTLRQFRQAEVGGWDDVVGEVVTALRVRLAEY